MDIRLLPQDEIEYRVYSIIHFFHFGVILSDVGSDFLRECILVEKRIVFPPLETSFLSVRLTKRGGNFCKQWAKNSGIEMEKIQKIGDFYNAGPLEKTDKFLMSHERLKTEFKCGKTDKLLRYYDFELAE